MPTKDSEPDELDPTVVDSTVLDDSPSFLHETGSTLSEFQEKQPAMVMLREKLVSNYQQLLKDQVIFSPVCYRFEKVLGRGRQSTVFLGSRQGARGCVTKHALKIFDPGIYSTAEK